MKKAKMTKALNCWTLKSEDGVLLYRARKSEGWFSVSEKHDEKLLEIQFEQTKIRMNDKNIGLVVRREAYEHAHLPERVMEMRLTDGDKALALTRESGGWKIGLNDESAGAVVYGMLTDLIVMEERAEELLAMIFGLMACVQSAEHMETI